MRGSSLRGERGLFCSFCPLGLAPGSGPVYNLGCCTADLTGVSTASACLPPNWSPGGFLLTRTGGLGAVLPGAYCAFGPGFPRMGLSKLVLWALGGLG